MNCHKYRELTTQEIDGELEEKKSLYLMKHLVFCNECRSYYESQSRIGSLVREEVMVHSKTVPESFSAAVMAKIMDEKISPVSVNGKTPDYFSLAIEKLRWFFSPKPALSLALTIFVISLLTISPDNKKPSSSTSFADAREIRANELKVRTAEKPAHVNSFEYYANRHEARMYTAGQGRRISKKNNLIYTTYEIGK